MLAHLTSRTCHLISGEDAASFMQGLISNDVRRAEKGELVYASMLSPQGKFLHDFFIAAHENGFLIDIDKLRAGDFKKRLMLYKLRSKVDIRDHEYQVFASWHEPKLEMGKLYADPRHGALGLRIYSAQALASTASEADYHAYRIALGVPDGAIDLIPEKSFLLEWGIDQLHGVDYQKGCYVGQEVTARTHYRGQVKKAPYIVSADHPLPPSGTLIYCGEKEVGELRSSAGNQGLALLRLEEVAASQASGMPLRVGDLVLSPKLPDWFTVKDK
jgi:folate-binding protein YgfZ